MVDFGNLGLWARMNDAAWLKLHDGSPETIATGDLDGNGTADLLAVFAGTDFRQKLNLSDWSDVEDTGGEPQQAVLGDIDDNGQDDIIGNFSVSLAMIMAKRNQSAFWSGLQFHGGDQLAVGNLDGI